jgi:hypothetical protein
MYGLPACGCPCCDLGLFLLAGWATAGQDGTRRSAARHGLAPSMLIFDPTFDIPAGTGTQVPEGSAPRLDDTTQQLVFPGGPHYLVFDPMDPQTETCSDPNGGAPLQRLVPNLQFAMSNGIQPVSWTVAGGLWYGMACNGGDLQVDAIDLWNPTRSESSGDILPLWSSTLSLELPPISGGAILVDERRSVIYCVCYIYPTARSSVFRAIALGFGPRGMNDTPSTAGQPQQLWTLDIPLPLTPVKSIVSSTEWDTFMLDPASGKLVLWWLTDKGGAHVTTADYPADLWGQGSRYYFDENDWVLNVRIIEPPDPTTTAPPTVTSYTSPDYSSSGSDIPASCLQHGVMMKLRTEAHWNSPTPPIQEASSDIVYTQTSNGLRPVHVTTQGVQTAVYSEQDSYYYCADGAGPRYDDYGNPTPTGYPIATSVHGPPPAQVGVWTVDWSGSAPTPPNGYVPFQPAGFYDRPFATAHSSVFLTGLDLATGAAWEVEVCADPVVAGNAPTVRLATDPPPTPGGLSAPVQPWRILGADAAGKSVFVMRDACTITAPDVPTLAAITVLSLQASGVEIPGNRYHDNISSNVEPIDWQYVTGTCWAWPYAIPADPTWQSWGEVETAITSFGTVTQPPATQAYTTLVAPHDPTPGRSTVYPSVIRQYAVHNGTLMHEVQLDQPGGTQSYTIVGFVGTSTGAVLIRSLTDSAAPHPNRPIAQEIGVWKTDHALTWKAIPSTIPEQKVLTGIGPDGPIIATIPALTGITPVLQSGLDLVTAGGACYVPCSDGHWRRIV